MEGEMTEPIMDASYLDDEIVGMMLTNDINNYNTSTLTYTTSNRPYGVLTQSFNNNSSSINNHQGQETIASITGSILDQLEDFPEDDDDDDELINFISESSGNSFEPPLTTPTNPNPEIFCSTFSTDSLDKSTSKKILQTKTENYTIAFQESDSSTQNHKTYKSILTQSCPFNTKWMNDSKNNNTKVAELLKVTKEIQTSNEGEKYLVCYPNYVLPDLDFIAKKSTTRKFLLCPKEVSRPASCYSSKALKSDSSQVNEVKDWESLKILLPREFQNFNKEKEKADDDEKEKDESESTQVKMRVKKQDVADYRKRYSLGEQRKVNKFKRFSLQEIQEITEISKGIESVLNDFEGFINGSDSQEKSAQQCHKTYESQISNHSQQSNQSQQSNRSHKVPQNTPVASINSMSTRKKDLTSQISAAITELTKKSPRSKVYSNSSHAKLVVDSLCPSLYAMLSDGLLPFIDTLFGRVPNTVWRVLEASIHSGPTSQVLAELVLRINSENELMADGPLKFNAFVCGLLNLGSLTSWLEYLRTKERLLRTHYDPAALMYNVNTLHKSIYDQMLVNTSALLKISYSLDIFYETKMLHQKFSKTLKMKRSFSDERPKPKSSRQQHQLPKSKTQHNIDKIGENNSNRFKKLQLQWELISSSNSGGGSEKKSPTSSANSVNSNSKIPRPIKSPTQTQKAFKPRPHSAYYVNHHQSTARK